MATEGDILNHLKECNKLFYPELNKQLDVNAYAFKIKKNAFTFEAWSENFLIGLVACYLNNLESKVGYISIISVVKKFHRLGIAKHLIEKNIEKAKELGFKKLKLEVQESNFNAIQMYINLGFIKTEEINIRRNFNTYYMALKI